MADDIVADTRPIVTRKEAKAQGLTRYFTGKPCPHGHVAERFVAGGGCRDCIQILLEKKRRDKGIKPRSKMSHAEFRAKRRPLNLRWREKNRERLASDARDYYAENRDVRNEANKDAYRRNPEPYKGRARQYRAQRRNAEGSHTAADIDRLFDLQKGKCAGSKTKLKPGYHIDHIVALSRGGSDFPANLQLLCPTCNHSKHALDPIEWAQRNGRLL